MQRLIENPSQSESAETIQANPICDVLSSGRMSKCSLTIEEQNGLRRIVREAKAPTNGLRTLLAAKATLIIAPKR